MKPKLLTSEDYFNFFNFQEHETGCGIEVEPGTRENYLFAQTYIPKTFFELDHPSLLFNPFLKHQLTYLPDKILVKFELFGIGSIGNNEVFVFKPWVIDIDNPVLYQFFENFHLYVPSILFYNLIERLVFLDQINREDFKYIRVLQDIPANTFERFGLLRATVPKSFSTQDLEISRIDNIDKGEILRFYSNNWESINTNLENKYFRSSSNTWFRIDSQVIQKEWFGLKQSLVQKTIGFLRLYNKNSSFSGGTSLEYIIDKSYRNKGYASQASLGLINYLKKYSYAISLGAEVADNNTFSKKVLKRLGFTERKPGPFNSDNFEYSLLNNLKALEKGFERNELKISVTDKYAARYSRYFQ